MTSLDDLVLVSLYFAKDNPLSIDHIEKALYLILKALHMYKSKDYILTDKGAWNWNLVLRIHMLESGGFINNVKNRYALTEKGFRLAQSIINGMSSREKEIIEELIKQIIQLKPEEILTIGNTFAKEEQQQTRELKTNTQGNHRHSL
jgi:predicted transcriptional regulator